MNIELQMLGKQISRLKDELFSQKESASSMEELVGHRIERDPGIWEMDFDQLEKEIWTRFENLEYNADCLEKKPAPRNLSKKDRFASFLRTAWRNIKNPLSRLYIEKTWKYNLDQQNQVNRDAVPFNLAVILTLQKIKDRLNYMEEQIKKIEQDQQTIYDEINRVQNSKKQKDEKY